MRACTTAERRLQGELQHAQARIARLVEHQKALPARIPLGESPHAAEAVKLSTERKHLTNVLKMVAYQIESALVEQLRPHYARTDDEGRTLIQSALRGCAAIAPTPTSSGSPSRRSALRIDQRPFACSATI